jgi:hypothetical protein
MEGLEEEAAAVEGNRMGQFMKKEAFQGISIGGTLNAHGGIVEYEMGIGHGIHIPVELIRMGRNAYRYPPVHGDPQEGRNPFITVVRDSRQSPGGGFRFRGKDDLKMFGLNHLKGGEGLEIPVLGFQGPVPGAKAQDEKTDNPEKKAWAR